MSEFLGYTETAASSPFAWLNPLSFPLFMLATTRIATFAWAFQQHGWSFCIPGAVLVFQKIAGLRWKSRHIFCYVR